MKFVRQREDRRPPVLRPCVRTDAFIEAGVAVVGDPVLVLRDARKVFDLRHGADDAQRLVEGDLGLFAIRRGG